MAAEEKYVLIARGGYLKAPILERFTISENDEEFAKVLIVTEEEFIFIKSL